MKLGLVGVNPITQLVAEIVISSSIDSDVVIYDDDANKHQSSVYGVTVKDSIAAIKDDFDAKDLDSLHICLGEKHLKTKKKLFDEFITLGIRFPNFIDQSCIISPRAEIGDGNLMSYGAIIGHNTKILSNTSIWAGAVIEHDSTVHGHCYIGPNVTISGFNEIGECSLIGSGAVILPEIKIGKHCLIGAGAVVTKDVADDQIIFGNPAK